MKSHFSPRQNHMIHIDRVNTRRFTICQTAWVIQESPATFSMLKGWIVTCIQKKETDVYLVTCRSTDFCIQLFIYLFFKLKQKIETDAGILLFRSASWTRAAALHLDELFCHRCSQLQQDTHNSGHVRSKNMSIHHERLFRGPVRGQDQSRTAGS